MTEQDRNQYIPDTASPPGETLEEVLDSRGMSDDYDGDAFKRALDRVRSLTRELPSNFASLVTRECNAAGVYIAFVPETPGTRTWGATRWL